jgi:hypothetical protein
MGIKFLCPNGHKLHVKSFLGGKRAICPKCGARVVVPSASESAAGASASRTQGDRTAGSPQDASFDDALEATAAALTSPGTTVDPRPVSPPPRPADPFDEAPGAAWYVRPASGGQFGPASAEIMRSWLAEGRVGTNSLVWRAPWPEWRSASATFAGLGLPVDAAANGTASQAALPVGYPVTTTAPVPAEVTPPPPSMTPLVQAARKRRKRSDVTLIASGLLALASLVLVIVLVLVWRVQTGESSPEAAPPAAVGEASPL